MEWVDICTKIIGNVGFPIAAFLLMFKSNTDLKKQISEMQANYMDELKSERESHKEELSGLQNSINGNTAVMNKILEKLNA